MSDGNTSFRVWSLLLSLVAGVSVAGVLWLCWTFDLLNEVDLLFALLVGAAAGALGWSLLLNRPR